MVSRSVRTRIALSLAVMLLPLLTLAGAASWALEGTLTSFEEAADEAREEALPLARLQTLLLQAERSGDQVLEAPVSDASRYVSDRDALQEALGGLDEEGMTEEGELAGAGRAHAEQAVRLLDAAVADRVAGRAQGGVQRQAPDVTAIHESVSLAVDSLRQAEELSEADIVGEYRHARAVEQQAISVIVAVTLLGLLVALAAGGRVAHSVLAPLTVLQQGARRLGQGVLSHRVVLPRADEFGELAEAFNAMAAEVERSQVELEHNALHDALTGLPNRVLLHDRVEQALARRSRDGSQVALLLIDLDGFKSVNDSLGHGAGDAVLQSAAARLRRAVRTSDTAARLGGDEFAVLIESDAPELALGVAEWILHAMRPVFRCEDRELFLTASIGLALAAASEVSSADLLRDADLAMYRAKDSGKDAVCVYDQSMHGHAEQQLQLEGDLRGALGREELALHYQPIYGIGGSPFVAVEALLRWNRPGHGLVPPLEFIPVAEATGLVVSIGAWVLDESCRQLRAWQDDADNATAGALQMSVNLSARQLADDALVGLVQQSLDRHGIEPCRLILEITESMMVHDVPSTIRRLHQLKRLGVQLAVDDFGTGYSSLGYLQQFPIDRLKIDKSFVDQLTNPDGRALVQGILSLARSLGLEPIAEGIEGAEQQAVLNELGCELAQGYHFARPETPDAITRRLASAPIAGSLAAAAGDAATTGDAAVDDQMTVGA